MDLFIHGAWRFIYYLYQLLIEYKKDREIDCIDSFMYAMDREINNLLPGLNEEEFKVLKNAFKIMWTLDSSDNFNECYQCENTQKFIGVSLS